jgi:nucleotide-binding universal stress UspA family protein
MYKQILCPVDGSPTSNRGMKEAIELAKNQNAKLRFIHVVDIYFPVMGGFGDFSYVDMTDVLRKNASKVIKKARSAAEKSGVVADASFAETLGGRPAEFILKEAKKWHADIIVMGTHGFRGVGRMVLGSDAEYVVRDSTVPVLLVSSANKLGKKISKGNKI